VTLLESAPDKSRGQVSRSRVVVTALTVEGNTKRQLKNANARQQKEKEEKKNNKGSDGSTEKLEDSRNTADLTSSLKLRACGAPWQLSAAQADLKLQRPPDQMQNRRIITFTDATVKTVGRKDVTITHKISSKSITCT
jgi:hypothetical protein